MDVVVLSRIQFALTSAFHYIYPPLSIGLGLLLVIIEGMYLKTKKPLYKDMARFWTKIFALTFALGVATGLVQVFGFGTNWSRYSDFVGDVFGSALASEGIFAFFLEAGFIGVMLFGWERVSARMHYLSTVLVAFGAHFSAIWIVAANSWMQTPAGYKLVQQNGALRAVVTDFWQMLFNPSFLDRITHVVLGCWLAGVFLVLSVGAYYLLKKKHIEFSRTCLKIGFIVGSFVLVLQGVSGDSSAKGVAVNQPIKLAAMEGVYETQPKTSMQIVGWVDTEQQKVKGIEVPGLLSFLVHGDVEKPVAGLLEFPREEWPNVSAVFQAYHAMILMWGLMVIAIVLGVYHWKRGTLDKAKGTLRFLIIAVLFPQIGNQVGWVAAEMGRQPWVVYKLLLTKDGTSPLVQSSQVLSSIIMFSIIYLLLLYLFLYLLDQKIRRGPEDLGEDDATSVEYRDYFKEETK